MSITMNLLNYAQALGWNIRRNLGGHADLTSPITIFHHIPKCGGTSLLKALEQWFILVRDYQTQWNMDYPPITNLEKLTPWHCLCGHFEENGYRLRQRYPEALSSDHYRLFTFIRDPLMVKLSLYRYETEHKKVAFSSVEECLLGRPNYMATVLQVNETDYRDALDRYFFIGILEEAQISLDQLAAMIGKKSQRMPFTNKTGKIPGTDVKDLHPELVAKFREINRLDYLIYDYSVERFKKVLQRA